MAIVIVRTALLHRAIDEGLDPTPGAIAKATGISERTMRRALAGAPVSDWTINALRHRFKDDSLFRIAITCTDPAPGQAPAMPPPAACATAFPGPRR